MTGKEVISIIVPVYNTAPYLDRCVASLCGQTYENIEIILVDDGSTDGSGTICDRHAATDSRIRALHKQNGGPTSACREGIAASRGTYLCFVDSDDYVEAEMIAAMATHLQGGREVVCCNIVTESLRRTEYQRHGLPSGSYSGDEHQRIFRHILGTGRRTIVLSRCMKLIARELIEDNLGYARDDLRYGEDTAIILPALFDSRRIVIMEDAFFYRYCYRRESATHGYGVAHLAQAQLYHQAVRQIMADKVALHGLEIAESEIEAQCWREYLLTLLQVIMNEARGNPDGAAYRKAVRAICEGEGTRALVRRYPLAVTGAPKRLLYLVLGHPCRVTFWLLRVATKIFYGVRS